MSVPIFTFEAINKNKPIVTIIKRVPRPRKYPFSNPKLSNKIGKITEKITAPNAYEAVTKPSLNPSLLSSVTDEAIWRESPYPMPLENPKKTPYPIIHPIQLPDDEKNRPIIGKMIIKDINLMTENF